MPIVSKLINYLKETKIELKHVNWPSKKTTVNFTFLVIGISFGVALYLGLFDKIFTSLLDKFIIRI